MSRMNPIDGKYSTLSATTKPVGKNKFDAGMKGTIAKVSTYSYNKEILYNIWENILYFIYLSPQIFLLFFPKPFNHFMDFFSSITTFLRKKYCVSIRFLYDWPEIACGLGFWLRHSIISREDRQRRPQSSKFLDRSGLTPIVSKSASNHSSNHMEITVTNHWRQPNN